MENVISTMEQPEHIGVSPRKGLGKHVSVVLKSRTELSKVVCGHSPLRGA
jgi:hypothetical protein